MKTSGRHTLEIPRRLVKIITGFLFVFNLLGWPAQASEIDASIIKEALQGVICDRNIDVIIEGANYQSATENNEEIGRASCRERV